MKRMIKDILSRPSGAPLAGKTVSVQLVVAAFADSGQREVLATTYATTDSTGLWTAELEINADLDPAGTYYTVRVAPGVIHSFVVPAGTGALWLRDCLVANPANPLPAVGASKADVTAGDASTLAAANAYTDSHGGSGGLPSVIDLGGPNNSTGA